MSEPWKIPETPWKTESAYMAWIRGGIRRSLWNRHPVKVEFMKKVRERVPLGRVTEKNPQGLVWGGRCNICKEAFRQNDLQVDHIEGQHSLKTINDLQGFVEGIVCVGFDDLQLLCKPCHDNKTHADKKGITFEEAKVDKQVIAFGKLKADKQMEKLEALGIDTSGIKNSKERKDIYRRYLGGE